MDDKITDAQIRMLGSFPYTYMVNTESEKMFDGRDIYDLSKSEASQLISKLESERKANLEKYAIVMKNGKEIL